MEHLTDLNVNGGVLFIKNIIQMENSFCLININFTGRFELCSVNTWKLLL